MTEKHTFEYALNLADHLAESLSFVLSHGGEYKDGDEPIENCREVLERYNKWRDRTGPDISTNNYSAWSPWDDIKKEESDD